jgi:hypothetical protein
MFCPKPEDATSISRTGIRRGTNVVLRFIVCSLN